MTLKNKTKPMATNNPQFIVVHHTASARDTTTEESVNRYHRDKDWDPGSGIAKAPKSSLGRFTQYHYFIEANGKVIQCAREDELRWHAGPAANTKSIAICMAGWFDPGIDDAPTPAQAKALANLLTDICNRYGFGGGKIFGHRDFMNKTCPGRNVTDEWLRSLIENHDPEFARKFEGRVIVAPEDHGRKWYIFRGKRYEIDKAPEFEARIRTEKDLAIWMSNADLAKIPKA